MFGFRRMGGIGRKFRRCVPLVVSNRYEYIGNCRCGTGPHAYYLDKESNMIVNPFYDVDIVNLDDSNIGDENIMNKLNYLEKLMKVIEKDIKLLKEKLGE